jgi:phosphatidylglycerol lysyltransferase
MKRRWIFWLLIIIFVWLVVTRFTEIEKLAITFAHGKWEWVLAAFVVQILYFCVFTLSYGAAFSTVEVKSRWIDLLPVVFGSLFVNVIVPTGGASGAALFADDAARRGESSSRAATGLLLQLITDFTAFALVLVVGMFYLFSQHDLKAYETITAFLLLAIIFGLVAILFMGLWSPTFLGRILGWLQSQANKLARWFKRSPFLKEDWADSNREELITAAQAMLKNPWRMLETLGFALGAHLLDVLTLYCLFLAFYQPIKFGPLVAGYAMGILFWIVSITPQGIGVVEGVMALVYTSLGIPPNIATTISLAFRGLTFWLPLLIGFVLLRRVKTFRTEERSLAESWSVRIMAILTALMGIINVLSAVTPSLMNRLQNLEEFSPLIIRHGGHLTAALAGFALLLLSVGLWRRKRAAWLATLIVLAISIISHLVKGLDYEEAILAAGLAAWLVSLRHHFHARSDRPSIRQGVQILIAAWIFTLFYGTLGFYLLDRHYKINYGFSAALRQTVVMFTQFYDPGLEPVTRFGRYFADSIYIIGAITTGYALLMLLRPVLLRELATPAEHEQAEQIVTAFGRSSLARLTLFDDKAYYFSPGGSLVAYAVRQRVGLVLGDPIGPPEDSLAAIQGFVAYCQVNDWRPAFYQVKPDYLTAYRKAGFDILCIGQEGIIDLASFTIEGKVNKPLRNAANRLPRTGHSFKLAEPPISESMLDELNEISDEWLTMMHGSEKSFSLGWFDDDYICNAPVATVCAADGRIVAFVNVVSEYQLNEITVDLMRHRREIEPGTMDFLFISLFAWAKERGYATFNLGLSALYGVGEHSEAPLPEKTLHYIYQHINQFYNFKGLHEFKDKYHPQWSPRYLAYPGAASLPVVGLALVDADSGKGGLVRGYVRKWKMAEAAASG